MQRWKQSGCIDLKRQFSEVDAASLALPGLPSSRQVCEGTRPPSEVQSRLLCMQGVNRRELRPDGMCSSDKMRKRETMRRREEGSLFSDECNIKEARWKSLKGWGLDPMEME